MCLSVLLFFIINKEHTTYRNQMLIRIVLNAPTNAPTELLDCSMFNH